MASWCVCAANTPTRYTVRNGEQQVLGRTDKTLPQQCIITIGNDGTGTVTSVGMGSTGVRENTSTPWEWLSKNQSKVIADGTMISLDVNNPEGLIFTCQVADRNGTLIEQMNMNKRKRVDVEKGELLIVIRTRSYSHAHTRTLILARSHTLARSRGSVCGQLDDDLPERRFRSSSAHTASPLTASEARPALAVGTPLPACRARMRADGAAAAACPTRRPTSSVPMTTASKAARHSKVARLGAAPPPASPAAPHHVATPLAAHPIAAPPALIAAPAAEASQTPKTAPSLLLVLCAAPPSPRPPPPSTPPHPTRRRHRRR
jgi:hypothetical protein